MAVLSKSIDASGTKKRLKQLINELISIIKEIWSTIVEYIGGFIPYIKGYSLSKFGELIIVFVWKLFIKIIKLIYKSFSFIFKGFYWLLAPNLLFRLSYRHAILFGLMFVTPILFRFIGNPMKYIMNYFITFSLTEDELIRYNELNNKIKSVNTYDEWSEISKNLDELNALNEWKTNPTSKYYDYKRIRNDSDKLRELIRLCKTYEKKMNHNNINNNGYNMDEYHPLKELMIFLRSRCVRNYCGVTRPELYNITRIDTKILIQDFMNDICNALKYVANYPDYYVVTIQERIVFFNEMRHGILYLYLCLYCTIYFYVYIETILDNTRIYCVFKCSHGKNCSLSKWWCIFWYLSCWFNFRNVL